MTNQENPGEKRIRKKTHELPQELGTRTIIKLCRRSGARRMSKGVTDVIRKKTTNYLEELMSTSLIFTKSANRKILTLEDIKNALKLKGIPVHGI